MALFAYGVVAADSAVATRPQTLPTGVSGASVRPFGAGSVAVLASPVDVPDDGIRPARRHVLAHMGVLDAALAATAVLPFRFGTVFPDEGALRGHLAGEADSYARRLEELSEQVQLTVTARYHDDTMVATVLADRPGLRREAAATPAVAPLERRLELGRRISHAAAEVRARDLRLLAQHAHQVADSVTVDQDSAAADVVRLWMLVRRDRVEEALHAIEQVAADIGSRMTVEAAGPMPAYAFVSA